MGHCREIHWAVYSTNWSLSLWSRPQQSNMRIQMTEPELSFNPLGPFWTKMPLRECINQAGLGLPLGEERSIVPRNGQDGVPSFRNRPLITTSRLSWLLPRKELRRDDPFWGTTAFSDQTALLRCVDQEQVREIQWQIFWSWFFEEAGQTPQYQMPVDGKRMERLLNTLTISPLCVAFATKEALLSAYKWSGKLITWHRLALRATVICLDSADQTGTAGL